MTILQCQRHWKLYQNKKKQIDSNISWKNLERFLIHPSLTWLVAALNGTHWSVCLPMMDSAMNGSLRACPLACLTNTKSNWDRMRLPMPSSSSNSNKTCPEATSAVGLLASRRHPTTKLDTIARVGQGHTVPSKLPRRRVPTNRCARAMIMSRWSK